jgi:hypothetical protein
VAVHAFLRQRQWYAETFSDYPSREQTRLVRALEVALAATGDDVKAWEPQGMWPDPAELWKQMERRLADIEAED